LEHEIPVEYLDAATLPERFPQFRYDSSSNNNNNMVGLLEPGGGFVRCEQVMQAALREAQEASHVEILADTQALDFSIVPSSKGAGCPTIELRVRTRGESDLRVLRTKCVLLAMGAWTGQLLPSWAPHLRATRQLQGWLDVNDNDDKSKLFGAAHMPTWVMVHPNYPLPLYGVPCDAGEPEIHRRQWLKVGVHGRDDLIRNHSLNPQVVSPMEVEETLQAISLAIDPARLNAATTSEETATSATSSSPFADIVPCLYTMTRDSHFMIGTPAGYSGVFAVAGLSGHGYKQTPVLGQMMVDYALGNDMSKWKSDFCTPSRFGV
jgi:sarcosine oxidase